MTGKLMYLLLMPLVYKLLQMFFLRDLFHTPSYKKHLTHILFYYVIEVIFVSISYGITKELIFLDNIKYNVGDFELFALASLAFIIVHLVVLFFGFIERYDKQDNFHCIVLFVLFFFFEILSCCSLSETVKKYDYDNMPYEMISEEVIQLEAFSDTHTTTGEVHGGRYYLNGQIQDNYEIYYSFLDEKGSLKIRSFVYSEAHCDIYPEEDCENPTLKITTYSKSYKDMSNTYCDYEIHIPKEEVGSNGIDMQ